MTEHQGPRAGPGERDTALAERFVTLADTLVDDFDLVELLDKLVRSCVELLDVSAAGLLLVDARGSLHPIASSTETTRLLELFQLQNDEGPASTVSAPASRLRPGHLAGARALATVRPAAAASGFRSVHALPCGCAGDHRQPQPLRRRRPTPGGGDQRDGQALADVATIGILQSARCTGPRSSPSSCRGRSTPGS